MDKIRNQSSRPNFDKLFLQEISGSPGDSISRGVLFRKNRRYFLVLIPSESGERVSFIVALELSMIFIQQAVDSYVVPAGQDRNFPFIRTVIIGKEFFEQSID